MPPSSILFVIGVLCSLPAGGVELPHSNPRLYELIENHYGIEVIAWEGQGEALLRTAMRQTSRRFNRRTLEIDRMNEVGLELENGLREALASLGVEAGRPRARSGRGRSMGYPDLTFQLLDQRFYLEVKTFSSATVASTQRTFYFSISEDPKVTEPAIHLLAGFEVQKEHDAAHRIVSYHVVDLRELPCKVKVEYNASNRELYGNPGLGFQIHESLPID